MLSYSGETTAEHAPAVSSFWPCYGGTCESGTSSQGLASRGTAAQDRGGIPPELPEPHLWYHSREPIKVIRAHLHAHKWALSAFKAELLRRPRWLLGAVPKHKQTLTVDAQSQNQRGRACLSNSDWDRYVNFACVFKSVMHEASLFILGDLPC